MAERRKALSGSGRSFYLSPDGNWLIWDDGPPTSADDAHRGLWYAMEKLLVIKQETPVKPLLSCHGSTTLLCRSMNCEPCKRLRASQIEGELTRTPGTP